MIVADASWIFPVTLGVDPPLRHAEELQEPEVHAPEMLDVEVLNALRKALRRGDIDDELATEAGSRLRRLPIRRYRHGLLLARVWALRDLLSAYDACYVALAELLDGELLTADRRMAVAATELLGAGRVRLVS